MSTWPEHMGKVAGVELWRMSLVLGSATLDALQRDLAADELLRAERLLVPDVRRRFVASRAGVRRILANHRGVDPQDIVFHLGKHGKPALEGGPSFSVSHSGELAVCGVSHGFELGVDIEHLRAVPEAESIAERHLRPEALAAIRDAGPNRDALFLRFWTRHEALLKALGVGLAAGPIAEADFARWRAYDLDPAVHYLGALVVET